MSATGRKPWLAFLVLAAAGAEPAHAEKLIVSLSTHRVVISSNFTGVDLTLFGAIERDAGSVSRPDGYALVTTVVGPRQGTIVWRKERILGVWVNASSRIFPEPPSFLAVLANRPIDAIAAPDVLRRFQIGLQQYLLPQRIGGDVGEVGSDDPYRQALIRLKTEQRLYRERGNAVTFLTPHLFRATVPLPSRVLVGNYEVEVKLFAGGVLIARETSAFEIIKDGFEQLVAQAAREHGLLYGLATMLLSLLVGWLGAVVFRRD